MASVEKDTIMRLLSTTLGIAALGISLSGCGGYGSNSGNPAAPSGNPTAAPDAIIINVVSENGAQSFSPNPSSVPDGRTVVWHNVDTITHRVVLNDRSVDTGNLAPGRYSSPMTLPAVGGYHCSIHPDMVGTVTR
jgi:plastocyanin